MQAQPTLAATAAAALTAYPAFALPAIGAPCHGGKFAGLLTGTDGAPYVLILLADKPDGELTHPAAMAWAAALGADLPNRPEGALLFNLLKADFEANWHWLNETTSWNPRAAWHQYFDGGTQISYVKGAELPARAVRRFPLQSFDPSQPAQQPAAADAGEPLAA